MSFQKFKSDSYCVGGRHRSSTVRIYGDKTSKSSKVLIGYCSICNKKTFMTVSDNTKKAEGFSYFFQNLANKGKNVSKKMATNVIKILGRVLEIGANVGTAFATRSPKAALLSLPEVNIFYHTGKGLYLGKFV